MRVRYSLPVTGKLRISDEMPIQLGDWFLYFDTNAETTYVAHLTIEIANIPKEKWPTLTTIDQNPNSEIPKFPFEVNSNAFKFKDIEQQVVNLESYLSVYGLEEIRFRALSFE